MVQVKERAHKEKKDDMKTKLIKIASDLENGVVNEKEAIVKLAELLRLVRKPVAWGCRTCNKIDWRDSEKSLAAPEHVAYRGYDIGCCKGVFVPLYD